MAAAADDKSFRFTDLPPELRNQIYSLLLCSFEPTTRSPDPPYFNASLPPVIVKHSIETAILQTNSRIHREAYDVMVKTNRFVRVCSTDNVPLKKMIHMYIVPVVTTNEEHITQFKGYVLQLELSQRKQSKSKDLDHLSSESSFSAMLLACDLDLLCQSLNRAEGHFPKFVAVVALDLQVGPGLEHIRPRYQDSYSEFFSKIIQETLLKTFQNQVRGLRNVKVHGCVSKKLAKATQDDMKSNEWLNSRETLETLRSRKEKGIAEFRSGNLNSAFTTWAEAIFDVGRIRHGTSWNNLVAQADGSFIETITELQFTMCLNAAHVAISFLDDSALHDHSYALITLPINMAEQIIAPHFSQKDYTYEPPSNLSAKLRYRQAIFLRRWGDVLQTPRAYSFIDAAAHLLPEDPKIREEEKRIRNWVKELGYPL